MARKIKLGYGKQVFFDDNNCKVEYNGQTIHQCNDPRYWKNASGGYIKDLCGKSFGEMATFIGYRPWINIFRFKTARLRFFSLETTNKINKWKKIIG